MILKGSQRAGALGLAAHLLNGHDNEHVELHEIRNFVADDLRGALQEARAISSGTRCKQFLFSLALSPPPKVNAPTELFEDALNRIEARLGLEGQPRVVVFHEKQGRRHAHCVWSRIDSKEMKAINLPYFKTRLMEVSKELYLEQGWKMPLGMLDRTQRNPLNYTREQWEQAKRRNDSPQAIKRALLECWAVSDNRNAFQSALERQGYYLAQGDRRGYVAVDWRGEVYSLSRWVDVPSKALKAKLGAPETLPSVAQTKAELDEKLAVHVRTVVASIRSRYDDQLKPTVTHRMEMTARHRKERTDLTVVQQDRWQHECIERNKRVRKGFFGLIDRFTGNRYRTLHENEALAFQAHLRDQKQREDLINRQLQERGLQHRIDRLRVQMEQKIADFRKQVFAELGEQRSEVVRDFESAVAVKIQNPGPELSM